MCIISPTHWPHASRCTILAFTTAGSKDREKDEPRELAAVVSEVLRSRANAAEFATATMHRLVAEAVGNNVKLSQLNSVWHDAVRRAVGACLAEINRSTEHLKL